MSTPKEKAEHNGKTRGAMCQGWGRLDLKPGKNEAREHAELGGEKDGDDTLLNCDRF